MEQGPRTPTTSGVDIRVDAGLNVQRGPMVPSFDDKDEARRGSSAAAGRRARPWGCPPATRGAAAGGVRSSARCEACRGCRGPPPPPGAARRGSRRSSRPRHPRTTPAWRKQPKQAASSFVHARACALVCRRTEHVCRRHVPCVELRDCCCGGGGLLRLHDGRRHFRQSSYSYSSPYVGGRGPSPSARRTVFEV